MQTPANPCSPFSVPPGKDTSPPAPPHRLGRLVEGAHGTHDRLAARAALARALLAGPPIARLSQGSR